MSSIGPVTANYVPADTATPVPAVQDTATPTPAPVPQAVPTPTAAPQAQPAPEQTPAAEVTVLSGSVPPPVNTTA